MRATQPPTGGVKIHAPLGGTPRLIGPLTGPGIETIPARTTLVGVRFHPGMAPPTSAALHDLVDEQVPLDELWGDRVHCRFKPAASAQT